MKLRKELGEKKKQGKKKKVRKMGFVCSEEKRKLNRAGAFFSTRSGPTRTILDARPGMQLLIFPNLSFISRDTNTFPFPFE